MYYCDAKLIFSIITPVFSITWSSEIILICWFHAQETFIIIIITIFYHADDFVDTMISIFFRYFNIFYILIYL